MVADPLALVYLNLFNLFWFHELLFQMLRVVHLITLDFPLILAAYTSLFNNLFTLHALVIMAFHSALMLSTRKESITIALASRDGIKARSSRALWNRLPSTRTELHSKRYFLAGKTRAFMANFLAFVVTTIKFLAAYFLTNKSPRSTLYSSFNFITEAALSDIDITLRALTLMALSLAVMKSTV